MSFIAGTRGVYSRDNDFDLASGMLSTVLYSHYIRADIGAGGARAAHGVPMPIFGKYVPNRTNEGLATPRSDDLKMSDWLSMGRFCFSLLLQSMIFVLSRRNVSPSFRPFLLFLSHISNLVVLIVAVSLVRNCVQPSFFNSVLDSSFQSRSH